MTKTFMMYAGESASLVRRRLADSHIVGEAMTAHDRNGRRDVDNAPACDRFLGERDVWPKLARLYPFRYGAAKLPLPRGTAASDEGSQMRTVGRERSSALAFAGHPNERSALEAAI